LNTLPDFREADFSGLLSRGVDLVAGIFQYEIN
jgi:hypothetical protein